MKKLQRLGFRLQEMSLHSTPYGKFLIALLFGLAGLFGNAPAAALDISPRLSAGYDDNVTRTEDEEGSGFGLYGLSVGHRLHENEHGLASDLYVEGSYQDYFDFSDNYIIKAGGETAWLITESLQPRIYYEGLLYRDNKFEEDDLNQFTLGGRMEWLASARFAAAVDQAVLFLDGEDETVNGSAGSPAGSTPIGRHGRGGGSSSGGMGGMGGTAGGVIAEVSGSGTLSRTRAELTFYPFPSLTLGTRLTYHRMWASEDVDAYRGGGAMLFSDWLFARQWKAYASFEYLAADYLDDPDDREDILRTVELGLIRSFGSFELFAEGRLLDIDSTINIETYQKTIIQCGVSWYF